MNVGYLACLCVVGCGGNVVVSQQQRPSVVVASGFLLPRGGEADGEQTVQVKFVTPFWRVQVKFDAPVSASRQIRYIHISYHITPSCNITALSFSVNALSCSGDLYLLSSPLADTQFVSLAFGEF